MILKGMKAINSKLISQEEKEWYRKSAYNWKKRKAEDYYPIYIDSDSYYIIENGRRIFPKDSINYKQGDTKIWKTFLVRVERQ